MAKRTTKKAAPKGKVKAYPVADIPIQPLPKNIPKRKTFMDKVAIWHIFAFLVVLGVAMSFFLVDDASIKADPAIPMEIEKPAVSYGVAKVSATKPEGVINSTDLDFLKADDAVLKFEDRAGEEHVQCWNAEGELKVDTMLPYVDGEIDLKPVGRPGYKCKVGDSTTWFEFGLDINLYGIPDAQAGMFDGEIVVEIENNNDSESLYLYGDEFEFTFTVPDVNYTLYDESLVEFDDDASVEVLPSDSYNFTLQFTVPESSLGQVIKFNVTYTDVVLDPYFFSDANNFSAGAFHNTFLNVTEGYVQLDDGETDGWFASDIQYFGEIQSYDNLSYIVGGDNMNITVRSCDDENCTGDQWNETFVENDTVHNLSIIHDPYFQYNVTFHSSGGGDDPTLFNVTVGYSDYPTGSEEFDLCSHFDGDYYRTYCNYTGDDSVRKNTIGSFGWYMGTVDAGEDVNWAYLRYTPLHLYGEDYPDNKEVEIEVGGLNMHDNDVLYHLDEQSGHFNDSSGTPSEPTNNEVNIERDIPGVFGTAIRCNGVDSHVNTTTAVSAISADYSVSVEAWIMLNETDKQYILLTQDDPPSVYHRMYIMTNNGYFLVQTTGGGTGVSSSFQPNLHEWYHVVWTIDDTISKLYINGVLDNQTTLPVSAVIDIQTIEICNSVLNWNHPFNGSIDEVAYYSRPILANEVLDRYSRGVGQVNVTVRSCDDAACSGESWDDFFDTPYDQNTIVEPENRYLQANFSIYSSDPDTVDAGITAFNVGWAPPTTSTSTTTTSTTTSTTTTIGPVVDGCAFNVSGTVEQGSSVLASMDYTVNTNPISNRVFLIEATPYEATSYDDIAGLANRTFDTTGLPLTDYHLNCTINDTYGSSDWRAGNTITLIAGDSPSIQNCQWNDSGYVINGTMLNVSFDYGAGGTGVDWLGFNVSGSIVAADENDSSSAWALVNSSDLGGYGIKTLDCLVNDSNYNVSVSDGTIELTGNIVVIDTCTMDPISTVPGVDVNISMTWTPGDESTLYVGFDLEGSIYAPTENDSSSAWYLLDTTLLDGYYDLTCMANDTFGNVTYEDGTLNVILNFPPLPAPIITYPEGGEVFNTMINITWNESGTYDPENDSWYVKLYLANDDNTTNITIAPFIGMGIEEWIWQTHFVDPGIYKLNVSVCDEWDACNSSIMNQSFTINAYGGHNGSMNEDTGIFTFTPTNFQQGNYTYDIVCSDGYDQSYVIWTLEVNNTNDAPVFIENMTNQSVAQDDEFLFNVNCTEVDPTNDTIVYYDNTTLFDIDEFNGMISWNVTDDDVGNYSFAITCGDGTDNNTQTLNVEVTNLDPVINYINIAPPSPTGVDDLECNDSYTYDVQNANYTWYLDGSPTAYYTKNLASAATINGDDWSCCVWVDDQWGATDEECSANVTIAGNNPPTTPELLIPLNGTGTVCATFFDWTDATDPDGDSVTYEIIVDDDSDFLSPAISFGGLGASTYTYGGCLADNIYYWKVRAWDNNTESSSWTDTWEFYIGPSCFDGIQNGGEEGVDCGGPCATLCPENISTYTDHCRDGIRNYWESDVDCGGSALFHDFCPPCGLGQRCVNQYKYEQVAVEYAEHDNCDRDVGLWCDDSTMRCTDSTPAQCSNKVLDTSIGETDIDCGGDCGPCDLGQRCAKDHENCDSDNYCDTRTGRCVALPSGYNRGYSAELGSIGTGKLEYNCPSHPHGGVKDISEFEMNLDCGANTLLHIIDFGERVLTENFDKMWPEGDGILHGFAVYSENGSIIYSTIPTLSNTSTADMESDRFYCVNVPLCDGKTYYYRYVVIDSKHYPPHIIYDSDTDLGGQTATKWGPARHYIRSDSAKAKQGIVHHESIFVEDMPNATLDLYQELIDACEDPDGETLIILNGSTAWPSSTCTGQRAWIVARLARHNSMRVDNQDYKQMIFREEVAEKWGEFYGVNPEGDVNSVNNIFYNYKIRNLAGQGDSCDEKTESGPVVEEQEQNDRRIGCMIIPMCKDGEGISLEYQLVASTPNNAPFRKVLYSTKWQDAEFQLNGLYKNDNDYAKDCHYNGYIVPKTEELEWETVGDSNIKKINVFGNVPIPSQMPSHNVTNDSVLTLHGTCDGSAGLQTSMQIFTDTEYFDEKFLEDRLIVGYEATLYHLAPSDIIQSIPEPYYEDSDSIDRVGSFGIMLNSKTPLHKIDIKNLCKDEEYAVYLRYFTPITNRTVSLPVSLDIIQDDTGGSPFGYAIDFDYAPVGFFWIQTPHPIVTRFTSVKVGQTMTLAPGEFLDYNVKELLTVPEDVGEKARLPWVGQTGEVDYWIKNLMWFVNPKDALGDMFNELYKIWIGPFFSPEDWKGIIGGFKATMAVFIMTLLRLLLLAIFTTLVFRLWTRILGNLDIWMIFLILFLVLIIILKVITYDTFISIITLGFR